MSLLPESETVEYKSTWTDASLHTLAAFANHQGGTLYIGVDDNGNVVGYAWTDDEQQRIVNQVTALGLRPEVRWETHGEKHVLCMRISPGTMPVACRGRYFTRVGSTTREMTADQLARRVLEKLGQTWDNLPSGIDPKESDPDALRHFIRLARGRLPRVNAEEPPERLLENLHLLRHGVLTNTGALLFAPQPQRLFPSAQVHIGRFQGGQVRDDRTVSGTLWSQLEGVLEALRGLLHVRFETRPHAASVEGMQRQEIWEYPLEALREAIINALVHRDYTVAGDIQIRVGEDTLEVWSPGLLPEGISIADIEREGHVSRPRNPALAQMFYFAGLIERWGVGTTLIQRACRLHDLPAPVFQEEMGGFKVSLSQNPYTPQRLRGLGLSDRHLAIVLHLKEHGTITNSEVQRLTGVSKATATRDLEQLVTHGLLVLQGRTGRGSRYVLKGS